jgi:hypothetical protein
LSKTRRVLYRTVPGNPPVSPAGERHHTSKSFVPNGAKVVPKRAKTICANSCQNSSGPYVILLISGVSIPDRAEPRENTELDLNKPYVSLNGTNFWCQKETCQQRVPKRDVPATRAKERRANACQKKYVPATRAKNNTCQRVPQRQRRVPKKKKKIFNKIQYCTVIYTSCVYHDEPRPLHVPCTQSALTTSH